MDAIALLVLYGKGQRDFLEQELSQVNLPSANLSEIDLQGSSLAEANLQEVDFQGADLQFTFFVGANLQGANLQGANLKRANLQGANLQNVNLKRANLSHANLQDANLQGANLQGANCRGADLRVANDEGVKWPYKKNLSEAILPAHFSSNKKSKSSRQVKKKSNINISPIELEINQSLPPVKIESEPRFFQGEGTEADSSQPNPKIKQERVEKNQNILERGDITEIEKIETENIKKLAFQIEQLEQESYFIPTSTEIYEERIFSAIAQRQGQFDFRRNLLEAYSYRCAVTGCDIPQILEAAYIIPYHKNQNNNRSNGLLLRADIHTLFDLNLIAIDPDEKIHVHPGLSKTSFYEDYNEKYLQPRENGFSPCKKALKERYDEWMNVWIMRIFDIGELFKI